MNKYQAIPEGYMRIGEMAKKAGVTVRTLQYYDKEGLLSPSAESEGGFRLYSEKDIARLLHILMMKELGFGLKDIKKQITSLDTPADVVDVLVEQAKQIRGKIEHWAMILDQIEKLSEEIRQVDSVDFMQYGAILFNLQAKNKHYWMLKHMDADMLKEISERMDVETAERIIRSMNDMFDEAAKLSKRKVEPSSKKGMKMAKEFWGMMMEISGGDMEFLQRFSEQAQKIDAADNKSPEYLAGQGFLGEAVKIYVSSLYKAEGEQND